MEPNAEPRFLLELAALLDERHRSDGARARRDRDAIRDADVARDVVRRALTELDAQWMQRNAPKSGAADDNATKQKKRSKR